jgi:enoyl-CoA hydratase/carnithine racemase
MRLLGSVLFCVQEAKDLGLVLDVVEPEQLMIAATDLARRIAGVWQTYSSFSGLTWVFEACIDIIAARVIYIGCSVCCDSENQWFKQTQFRTKQSATVFSKCHTVKWCALLCLCVQLPRQLLWQKH